MRRYRLRAGEDSSRYAPGQFVNEAYARRYPHKVQLVRKRRKPKVPKVRRRAPVPKPSRDWEVSIRYRSQDRAKARRGRVDDITIRVIVPPGMTMDEVKRAVWLAYRQGADALSEIGIYGIDWRQHEREGEHERVFRYPSEQVTTDEALQSLGGILREEPMSKWGKKGSIIRIAPVGD